MNPQEIIEKIQTEWSGKTISSNEHFNKELNKTVIQTIISLYEQELKEIPEEKEIPIPYYSGVHGYQDQYERDVNKANTNLGYNQALQDIRQSIQSKLDKWNELLVNSK